MLDYKLSKPPARRDRLVSAKPGQAKGSQIDDGKTGADQKVAEVAAVEDTNVGMVFKDAPIAKLGIGCDDQQHSSRSEQPVKIAANYFRRREMFDDVLQDQTVKRRIGEGQAFSRGANQRNRWKTGTGVLQPACLVIDSGGPVRSDGVEK